MIALKTFKQFKKLASNSIEEFNPTKRNIKRWEKYIKITNIRLAKLSIKIKSSKEVREAVDWKQGRIHKNFEELPKHFQEQCLRVAEELKKQGATKVILFGSLTEGHYLHPSEDVERSLKYRYLLGHLKEKTDLDLEVFPKEYNYKLDSSIIHSDINLISSIYSNPIIIYEKK